MSDVTQLDEQPRPSPVSLATPGRPIVVEMYAPNGGGLAAMMVPEMPPEDIIFSLIPKFRALSGVRMPIFFKSRAATDEELAQVFSAQAQESGSPS